MPNNSNKTRWFYPISVVLLTICLLIQQKTLNNHSEAIESINISVTTPGSVTRIEGLGVPEYLMPEIPKDTIFSSYRVSYEISSEKSKIIYFGLGSATGYAPRELISCAHLFTKDSDPTHYKLDIFDKNGIFSRRIPFKIEKLSEELDLAKLVVDENLPYYTELETIENFNNIGIGDWVFIIGAAGGQSPFHITWGEVSSKAFEDIPELFQTSALVAPGNSGGAVRLAKTGKQIGVLVRGGQTISLFVPLTVISKFLMK